MQSSTALPETPSQAAESRGRPLRVCHAIPHLYQGGAEAMLEKIVLATREFDVESEVVALGRIGPVGERLRNEGVPVREFRLFSGPVSLLGNGFRLAVHFARSRPDVVQTWMYHADLLAGLAAAAARRPVVWNIRHSTLDPQIDSAALRRSAWCCGKLSRSIPSRILINSQAAIPAHVRAGYDRRRMHWIPNGFDVARFRPDAAARIGLRRELGLSDSAKLVGLVGRAHPHKDHATFLKAFGETAQRIPAAHAVLVGEGVASFAELVHREESLRGRVTLLGPRGDLPRLQAAWDVAVCASVTEGFPNVVGEAMSCGVPCVVTDVGDCAAVVGDTGIVVPPQAPGKLAAAMTALLLLSEPERRQLGQRARQRIVANFELSAVARQYVDVWRDVARWKPHAEMPASSAARAA